MDWTVTVVLEGDKPKRLADARVTVMTDEAKGVGVEVVTDRYGRAAFQLSDKVRVLDAVYVDPRHSGWPVALTRVPLAPGGMQVGVPRIDLSAPDVRGWSTASPAPAMAAVCGSGWSTPVSARIRR
ncbi:hypothetical protein [Methylibium rhizosphaerae]|uniref:hypothetical protein n=1 Tax=Methylibium rhizosphaerae TaxID=2570323 RepID=UPI0015E42009|nr:hypothetical protein [Methylibium rhizosphaerae]